MRVLPFSYELLSKCQKVVQDKDSTAYVKSGYNLKLQRIQVKASSLGKITPSVAAKAILSQLDAEDFEKPYYRAFVLLTAAMMLERDTAYNRKIPKQLEEPKGENTIDPALIITIQVNRESQTAIDGTVYDNNDNIEKAYYLVHDRIGPEAIIRFEVSPLAPYEKFARTQSLVQQYAHEAREKEAERSFHKRYDALSESQKTQVDEAHPIHMIEVKMN
jgi:hypothetical protein